MSANLRLLRLSNSIPASFLVLIGAWLTTGWPLPTRAWQAAISMWFVTAFGYASNDLCDVTEDRINKPDRPLPSGAVSIHSTRRLVIGLAVAALSSAARLGVIAFFVAALVLSLLWLYNKRLKGSPGYDNLLIALLAGCVLPVGAVAVKGFTGQPLTQLILPAGLLSCFVAAREITKTLEDMQGDRLSGKQTLATQLGIKPTLLLIAGFTLTLVGSTLYAWWQNAYSNLFLILTIVGVIAPLCLTVVRLWHEHNTARVSGCLALLKASYFIGMVGLIVR